MKSLLRAADLSPSDPRCYFFLSKAYDSSPGQADDVIQRFRALLGITTQQRARLLLLCDELVEGETSAGSQLSISIRSNRCSRRRSRSIPNSRRRTCSSEILYSDQTQYADSIPEYLKALAINPNLADAHYRLGQAYVHTGEKEKAQEQFAGLSEAASATSGRSRQTERGYSPVRVLGAVAGEAVAARAAKRRKNAAHGASRGRLD